MTSFRLLVFAAALSLGCAPGIAAPPATPGFSLIDSVSAGFSYTAETDLRNNAGKLTVHRYEFETVGRTSLSSGGAVLHGVGWVRTELDTSPGSLLPETLQELSLRLGWQYQRDSHWRFMASLRPGFFGDRSAIDTDTLNAPFLGLASYAASRQLIWSFGIIANAFADNPVLPVAGVRWEFAPSWTLSLAYPRAGVSWEVDRSATITAGATFQGGAYRLTRTPPGTIAGTRSLVDSELDYREIRLGVGGSFKVSAAVTLTVDVGVTVDQRFDFHERGLEQRGDDTGFGAISLTGRF